MLEIRRTASGWPAIESRFAKQMARFRLKPLLDNNATAEDITQMRAMAMTHQYLPKLMSSRSKYVSAANTCNQQQVQQASIVALAQEGRLLLLATTRLDVAVSIPTGQCMAEHRSLFPAQSASREAARAVLLACWARRDAPCQRSSGQFAMALPDSNIPLPAWVWSKSIKPRVWRTLYDKPSIATASECADWMTTNVSAISAMCRSAAGQLKGRGEML